MHILSEVCPGSSFDFSSLTAFSMGDTEAATEIMQTFIEETEKKYNNLRQAWERKDIKSITSITHQLMPLFKMLKDEQCLPELMWMEEKRDAIIFPDEAEEKIRKILDETGKMIREAKRTI